jgi:hypothetical protein
MWRWPGAAHGLYAAIDPRKILRVEQEVVIERRRLEERFRLDACDNRYRITLGGLDALRPLCIYVESVE